MQTVDKVMDTTNKKLNLIHWVAELDDEVTLNASDVIKEQSTQKDWWNNTVFAAEKNSIEQGLRLNDEGKVYMNQITHQLTYICGSPPVKPGCGTLTSREEAYRESEGASDFEDVWKGIGGLTERNAANP